MRLVSFCAAVVVVASFSLCALAQPIQSPSTADLDWLALLRQRAFESLMPMDTPDEVLVAYRSYRDLDHDVLERHFTIRFTHRGVFDRDALGIRPGSCGN